MVPSWWSYCICSNFCGKFCIPSEIRSPIAIVHYKRVVLWCCHWLVQLSPWEIHYLFPCEWMYIWTRMLSLAWRCLSISFSCKYTLGIFDVGREVFVVITVQFHRIQVPSVLCPLCLLYTCTVRCLHCVTRISASFYLPYTNVLFCVRNSCNCWDSCGKHSWSLADKYSPTGFKLMWLGQLF
jgi:hypothetical protein